MDDGHQFQRPSMPSAPGPGVDGGVHGAAEGALQGTTHCKTSDFSKRDRAPSHFRSRHRRHRQRHNREVPVDDLGVHDRAVTFRTGTATDTASVLDLWVRARAHPTSTDDASSLAALAARDPDALLIAEIDGHVVGTLIATWDGWRGNMYRLAVAPSFRRRGIAARLVGHGERRLLELGCRRVQALVVDTDTRADAFWTGVDYIPDSLQRYVHTLGGPAS